LKLTHPQWKPLHWTTFTSIFAGTERLYPDYQARCAFAGGDIWRTGLNVSIGRGANEGGGVDCLAAERPRGFRVIASGEEEAFLTPLPVEKLHGIGHCTPGCWLSAASNHRPAAPGAQARAAGCLRRSHRPANLGTRPRAGWPRSAAALDAESVSRETTIEGGTIDTEFLGGLIEYLSERIGSTLRDTASRCAPSACASAMSSIFGAPDSADQQTNTTSANARHAKDSLQIVHAARGRAPGRRQRDQPRNDKRQHELFDTNANRRWYLNRGLDSVRGRYGWNAASTAKASSYASITRPSRMAGALDAMLIEVI